MELLVIVVMILLGVGIAAGVALVAGIVSSAEKERNARGAQPVRDRESIAASIVYQIASAGGVESARVLAYLREEARLSGPVTRNVDVGSWAEAYRRISSEAQRAALLEVAVKTAVALSSALPLTQYNALLDLSFGLGFQTDALARLRARYRFEYTDFAKAGRPRSADRTGGAAPLFDRQTADPEPLLKVLGLSGMVSRHDLTTTYRRLAAQHHPDRFHNASEAQQGAAAARFIELTEAYEKLLLICGES